MRSPRYELAVQSAGVTGDGRTLVLGTALMAAPAGYAIALPGMGRPAVASRS